MKDRHQAVIEDGDNQHVNALLETEKITEEDKQAPRDRILAHEKS